MNALPVTVEQRPVLRILDVLCRNCHVEATASADHVCQLCRALGKTFEPAHETTFREDVRLGIRYAGKHLFGFKL